MKDEVERLLETLNARQRSLQEYFEANERLTFREYKEMHPEISERTARYDIEDLVKEGILVKHGKRRGTYYALK